MVNNARIFIEAYRRVLSFVASCWLFKFVASCRLLDLMASCRLWQVVVVQVVVEFQLLPIIVRLE